MYTHAHVCSFLIVLSICVFSGLSVWSGQPIVWSFMGEATSPVPNFPRLPILLCIGLRRHRFVSIQFDIFIGVTLIQLTFGQPCWWGSTGIASDFIRGCNLTANYSDSLWPLTLFPPPFPKHFLSLKCRRVLRLYPLALDSTAPFWLVVVFFCGLRLLQRELSLKTILICGYKDRCL